MGRLVVVARKDYNAFNRSGHACVTSAWALEASRTMGASTPSVLGANFREPTSSSLRKTLHRLLQPLRGSDSLPSSCTQNPAETRTMSRPELVAPPEIVRIYTIAEHQAVLTVHL